MEGRRIPRRQGFVGLRPGVATHRDVMAAPAAGFIRPALAPLERLVCAAGEDEETRARKTQFVAFAILVSPAAIIWAAIYYSFGEPRTALIPFTYAVLTALDILLFVRFRRF